MTNTTPKPDSLTERTLLSSRSRSQLPTPRSLTNSCGTIPSTPLSSTEYAIELALSAIAVQNEPIDMPVAITTPNVSLAMSRFHNRLYAVRKQTDAEAAKLHQRLRTRSRSNRI